VELLENERWAQSEGIAWSKASFKTGQRVAWNRARGGGSAVAADGSSGEVRSVVIALPLLVGPVCSHGHSSNLKFPLGPGWAYVDIENWRADVEAKWSEVVADNSGWVYTNDAWLEPHALPLAQWKVQGAMTWRRRWVRRIYLDPTVPAMSSQPTL